MSALILLCTVFLCTMVGVGLGGLCLLAFLGLVSRMMAAGR